MTAQEPKFGTDGVRGIANAELTAAFALKLGIAAAHTLAAHDSNRRVIVGRDTRISGDMLEAALSAGLASAGCHVTTVGVVPTPAVSHIVVRSRAAAGCVISASHNPFEDNGIKFLGSDGRKLPDALEEEMSRRLAEALELPRPTGRDIGRIIGPHQTTVGDFRETTPAWRDPVQGYLAHVAATSGGPLDGFRLVLDCANGATAPYAPALFADLGAEVEVLHASPDGTNINRGCGSTCPDDMCARVREVHAHAGLAFDGDGDRVILCDENGVLVDGDRIMALCALGMKQRGELNGHTVVATVMSNAGFEAFLEEHGIKVVRTDVGDRYVAEEMLRLGASLGGEQSGHIIFSALTLTGDGMVTGLQVLREMRHTGEPLSRLAGRMPVYPQLLKNVRVVDRHAWKKAPQVKAAIEAARQQLGKPEWLSVRPSGTEPVVRVMAQGPDANQVEQIVSELCDLIQRYGGGTA